ncbi:MAG: universal stress protein [Rhodothermia bacterium]|nr:universal stress protein [Rhodothermia bacterium]
MHRRIVVGVDFSATSHAALEQALFMAKSADAELHVVHVIDVFGSNPLVEVLRSAVNEEEVEKRLIEESDGLMRRFVKDVDFGELRTRFVHTRAPNIAEALLEYVKDQRADLLAVGSHGRGAIKRLFLGSVAIRVMQSSTCSLLIVKSHKAESIRDPIDRVLVPVDLSEISRSALREARAIASGYHAHMDILHVVEPYSLPVSLTGIKKIRDLVPTILSDVENELQDLVASIEGSYVPHSIHVAEGSAAEAIDQASRKFNSDLIVMAKRRVTPLERVAFGSTIEKVARVADVPVYVIPITPVEDAPRTPLASAEKEG